MLAHLSTGDLVGIGQLVFGAAAFVLAAVFGVPAWRLARHAEAAQHTQQLAEDVAKYLGIPPPSHSGDPAEPPTPEHPSIIDLLTDVRDATQEQAALSTVVAYHLADKHGGEIPPWLQPPEQ